MKMLKSKFRRLSKSLVVTLLAGLLTLPALPAVTAYADYQPELPSLYQTYNNYFTFGVFQSMGSYFGGDPAKSMLQHHYLSWSPSNEFKPSSLFGTNQSSQAYNAVVNATYSSDTEKAAALDKANRTVILASTTSQETFLQNVRNENKKRGPNDQIRVKAHTLLWHNMTPEQFFHDGFSSSNAYSSPSVMLDRIDSYIGAVFQRFASYGDVIYSWDVVNEAVDDFTGYIRNEKDYQLSNWGRIFKRPDETGTQRLLDESVYIRQAFASARKYERELGLNWTLGYNDFFDADKSYEPKRSATVTILKPIYEAGNIDFYGFQGRNATALSLDIFKETYAMFSTVCNQIQFTESDTRSDLVPNPSYDPNDIHANYYLQYGSVNPNWNRNDIHSPLLIQAPGWQASWANQTTYQQAQADWLADYFDFLLQNSAGNGGKIVMYAVDGLNDASTFNSNKGCSMFMSADSSGNTANTAKMSYFAVIGSKARFELNKKLVNLPDPTTQGTYTVTSWAAYTSALDNARNVLKARIYDLNGVNNVNAASDALTKAINGLTETATSLSALTVNNEPIKGFNPDTHTYTILTPIGAVPKVAATTAADGAAVEIAQASGLPGKAVVTVKKDGKQDTYTVNFTVDTGLSSITVNGSQISGFSPDKYTYSMQVSAGSIPQVQAIPKDPGAKVEIAQAAALPGQATVTVSYGSALTVYTANFTVDTSLSSLKVNGTTISGFNPGVYTYNALLTDKMTVIPQVQAVPSDPGVKVAIEQVAAVPGQAIVTVSCGSAQTVYKINFSSNLTGNDEFDGPTLNTSLWHWVNEDPSTWSLASNPGNMTIGSRKG
ncbi:MAG: endo-1,4-beta-xylanase, partial [Bacillota bacterium]|nr:endo-1,4-beta-xylanase [Bacillota bacterium]